MEIPLINNLPDWLVFLLEIMVAFWLGYIVIFTDALAALMDKYGFLPIIITIGLLILWIIVGIPLVLFSLIIFVVFVIYWVLQGRQKNK